MSVETPVPAGRPGLSGLKEAAACHLSRRGSTVVLGARRGKFAADGSASERTMRMSTPYVGTTDYGILTMTQEEIHQAVMATSPNFFNIANAVALNSVTVNGRALLLINPHTSFFFRSFSSLGSASTGSSPSSFFDSDEPR